ncbi:MAG: prefoldin subunit alpha [Candidatus Heimdallarchaeota archaeon]|nr:prefoldin subunit alpha [Candidatus Heimdallarchaeota archaeon]
MSNKISSDIVNRIRELQNEIEQLQTNLNAIEQQMVLLSRAIGSINDSINTQNILKTKNKGDHIMVPIGGSSSILCTVDEPYNVIVSLGSGISLKSTLQEAEERSKNQLENLESSRKKIQEQYSQFVNLLNERRQELLLLGQQHGLI